MAKIVAKTVKFALIASANLDKEMKNLVTAVGKLDDRIQLYLLSELAHINEHKNPTRLNSFFNAMKGKGSRVTAMSAYVQKFGTLKFDEERLNKETNEKGMFVYSDAKAFDLEAAKLVKWYSMKPEGKLQAFDLMAQVQKLLDLAVARAADEERKEAGDKVDLEMVAKIAAATGLTPKSVESKAKAKAETPKETAAA